MKYGHRDEEDEVVFNDLFTSCINKWELVDGTLKNVSLPMDELPWRKYPQAWKGNEKRWRNVLISHPPIRRISIAKHSMRLKAFRRGTGVQPFLHIPEGLRLGLLKDQIEDWYVSNEHSEFDSKIRRERVGTGRRREFGVPSIWNLRRFEIRSTERETVDRYAKGGKCFLRVIYEMENVLEDREELEVGKPLNLKEKKRVLGWMRRKLGMFPGRRWRKFRDDLLSRISKK